MQYIKKTTTLSVIIIFLFAIIIGSWSYLAIWLGDDIHYGFFCDDPLTHSIPIESPWDIFASQYNHYLHSNGRFVAHWLVQWFIVFGGRTLFSITNALVYVVLVVYVLRLCNMRWQSHPRALLFTIAILFIAFRTKFVPSCQIGYIWMMASSAVAMDLLLNVQDVKRAWIAPVAIFCFLAGWGNEAISAGVVVAIFGYIFMKKRQLTTTQWVVAVSYCVGALILIIAPSNFLKVADPSIAQSFPPLQIKLTINYMAHLSRMLYLLATVIIYMLLTHRASLRNMYKDNAFYINALFTLIAFNFVITVYCNRQLFGIEFFALIIAVRLIARYGLNRYIRIIGFVCLFVYVIAICKYNYSFFIWQQSTYKNIVKQHEQSDDGIVFCDFQAKHSLFYAEEPNMAVESSCESIQWKWRSEGNKKPLQIYPKCLKGKTRQRLKTQAVNLGNGLFLLISSNYKPAKRFVIHLQHKIGSFTKQCDGGVSVPDHDTDIKQKAPAYRIRCPHFIATMVSGDNLTKYISSVDIEY